MDGYLGTYHIGLIWFARTEQEYHEGAPLAFRNCERKSLIMCFAPVRSALLRNT